MPFADNRIPQVKGIGLPHSLAQLWAHQIATVITTAIIQQ